MEKVRMALEEVTEGMPWLWEAIQSPSAVEVVTHIDNTDGWQWAAIVWIGIVALAALLGHFKDDK